MKLKSITSFGAAAAVVLALTSTASALPYIIGVYGFSGSAVLDSTNTDTATSVVTWGPQSPGVLGGTYSSLGLTTPISIVDPWTFSAPAGPVIPNFWTAGSIGGGFTFDLTSSVITFQSGGTLRVSGTGIVKHAGYEDTSATFNFTTQNPGVGTGGGFANFTVSSSGESVPDGGATIALLGVSMLGLHGIRRKFAKR